MKLYVIRHATAEQAGSVPDAERKLTGKGAEEAREVGRLLKEQGAAVGAILASPLFRARETARLVSESFDPPLPVETVDALACGASPAVIQATVRARAVDLPLAVVGHNPDVTVFVRELAGDVGEDVSFKPCSTWLVDLDGASPPRRLR